MQSNTPALLFLPSRPVFVEAILERCLLNFMVHLEAVVCGVVEVCHVILRDVSRFFSTQFITVKVDYILGIIPPKIHTTAFFSI